MSQTSHIIADLHMASTPKMQGGMYRASPWPSWMVHSSPLPNSIGPSLDKSTYTWNEGTRALLFNGKSFRDFWGLYWKWFSPGRASHADYPHLTPLSGLWAQKRVTVPLVTTFPKYFTFSWEHWDTERPADQEKTAIEKMACHSQCLEKRKQVGHGASKGREGGTNCRQGPC